MIVMGKLAILFTVCMYLTGCGMPTRFEYKTSSEIINTKITIIDLRPNHERKFNSTYGGSVNYYYSDENFNTSLTEILRDRISKKLNELDGPLKIDVISIVLAASKPNSGGYVQVHDVSASIGQNIGASVLTIPVIGAIEDIRNPHSVWCRIKYKAFGKLYEENEEITVSSSNVDKAVIGILLHSVDSMSKRINKIMSNDS